MVWNPTCDIGKRWIDPGDPAMGTVLLLSITHNHISSHQSKKQCSIHTGIPVVPNMVGVFGILNSLKEGVIVGFG